MRYSPVVPRRSARLISLQTSSSASANPSPTTKKSIIKPQAIQNAKSTLKKAANVKRKIPLTNSNQRSSHTEPAMHQNARFKRKRNSDSTTSLTTAIHESTARPAASTSSLSQQTTNASLQTTSTAMNNSEIVILPVVQAVAVNAASVPTPRSIEAELGLGANLTLSQKFNVSLSEASQLYLKSQLVKARVKFDKACRQLTLLNQHINDLQNSYYNSLEADKKTFKIVYRMQLATLEGTHTAYIEYIERQVEKIRKFKRLLFNEADATSSAAASIQ